MCGIAGICHLDGLDGISPDAIRSMIGVMGHRGPDETGIYLDDGVGLGHARLSIIDLSSGTQPIHNEDEEMWIVYNGEVFNYLELRQALEQKGHRFYTTSDTEVVLHLYEEEGPAFLEKLNGQFAMAIWDTKKKELFLARDRLGIRPLHYTIANRALVFGSEIKSIFMCDDVNREIDPVSMDQIFTFWTTLTPRTVFKDIYELPPGHYLKTSNGKVTLRKYWEIPLYGRQEQHDTSPQEICRQVQDLQSGFVCGPMCLSAATSAAVSIPQEPRLWSSGISTVMSGLSGSALSRMDLTKVSIKTEWCHCSEPTTPRFWQRTI